MIALIAIGLASSAVLASHAGRSSASDAKVVITSGGRLFATYPLSEDREIRVPSPEGDDDYNIVLVKSGDVSVEEASCKNKVCIRHGAISKSGESIICLPNRLIVSIEGSSEDEGGGYDSITS